jgi:hypothetical protein
MKLDQNLFKLHNDTKKKSAGHRDFHGQKFWSLNIFFVTEIFSHDADHLVYFFKSLPKKCFCVRRVTDCQNQPRGTPHTW